MSEISEQWNQLLSVFEEIGSCDVTRRALTLGSRDSVTGWYAKSFAETTIKMIIIPRGARNSALPLGVFARMDAVGLTRATINVGDEVKDADNEYFEVKDKRKWKIGATLYFYKCDLAELPLHV